MITLTGTVAYRADGTYSVTTTSGGSLRVHFPEACLSQGAVMYKCSDIAAESASAFQSVTCLPAEGGCTCTYVPRERSLSETGTYVTSGSTLTRSRESQSKPFSYCIKGDQLHQTETTTMSMGMMGQMTASTSLALKRK